MSGMTVGDVCRTLLFELPVDFDGSPTRDAVLQFTLDGESFYAIDQFIDYGDGGVVAQLMPWPPEHEENWADPEWRRKMHEIYIEDVVAAGACRTPTGSASKSTASIMPG